MHTIKITPNLPFEYQCTSGKFIRLPNRIESKLFLPELECSTVHRGTIMSVSCFAWQRVCYRHIGLCHRYERCRATLTEVIGSCRVAPLQQQVRVAMVTGAERPTDARRLLGLLQPTEMLVKVVVSARSADKSTCSLSQRIYHYTRYMCVWTYSSIWMYIASGVLGGDTRYTAYTNLRVF